MELKIWFFLFATAHAKLACDYLSMSNGQIAVDGRMCLGTCPKDMHGKGVYIANGQTLFFPSSLILTTSSDHVILSQNGQTILDCNSSHCFAGRPLTDTVPPGFYLTGVPGGPSLNLWDPWTALSTVQLHLGSLTRVSLISSPSITGWRLVVGTTVYTFTPSLLVVGMFGAGEILAAVDQGIQVLAAGPVVVRKGLRAYPIDLPIGPSVTLIFSSRETANCNLLGKSFTLAVPMETCVPVPSVKSSAFPEVASFFQVSGRNISFYSDECRSMIGQPQPIAFPCALGWSGVFLA